MQGNGVETPRVPAWPPVHGNKGCVLPREGPALSCRVQLPGPSGFASRAKWCSARQVPAATAGAGRSTGSESGAFQAPGLRDAEPVPCPHPQCRPSEGKPVEGPVTMRVAQHTPKPLLSKLVESDQKLNGYFPASQIPHMSSVESFLLLRSKGDPAFVPCGSGRSRMTNGQRQRLSSDVSPGVDHWLAVCPGPSHLILKRKKD